MNCFPEAACGLLLKLNRDFRPVQSFSAKHGEQVPGASLSSYRDWEVPSIQMDCFSAL
uniref:Uncharacterized protein n=1 Tax=Faecalibaculum rodentium TaxID=1702221 RepID=A0A140DRU1_9FIRM|nr:hypothetical protein AALO17_02340 [Faecalibaculum rodentium]